MSTSIDQVFIEQFEREVHHAFQREASHLKGMTRELSNVIGYQAHFPKLGTASVVDKTRHAEVPLGDLTHTRITCTLTDKYSAEMVDELDTLKTNVQERMELAKAISYALGRQCDQYIVDALDAATTNQTSGTGKITLAKVNEVYTFFGNEDVPDDGGRFMGVSPKGWTDLMALDQFLNADYVPESDLIYPNGRTAKQWFSFYVFTFSGFSKSGNTRTSQAWHKRAVGTAYQQDPQVKVDWENLRQAYSIVGSLAMGSTAIDADGIYQILHDETAT